MNATRKTSKCPMAARCVLLVLALSLLTGCAASYKSHWDPKTSIPDHSPEIAVGVMDRAAVRSVLGSPLLSSAYWGFDLFRADTEQTEVVFAVTPFPVPFARLKDRLQRYTLVAYDADGRPSMVATGLFRKPAKWRNVSPIQSDFPSLHLRAGELMFFVDPEGARDVNLLVSPQGRDIFLRHAHRQTAVRWSLDVATKGAATNCRSMEARLTGFLCGPPTLIGSGKANGTTGCRALAHMAVTHRCPGSRRTWHSTSPRANTSSSFQPSTRAEGPPRSSYADGAR